MRLASATSVQSVAATLIDELDRSRKIARSSVLARLMGRSAPVDEDWLDLALRGWRNRTADTTCAPTFADIASDELDAMLARPDFEFVRYAQASILGRPRDEAGVAADLDRLRGGLSRLSWLEELLTSNEAAANIVENFWFLRAVRRCKPNKTSWARLLHGSLD